MILGLPVLEVAKVQSVFLVLTKRKAHSGDEVGEATENIDLFHNGGQIKYSFVLTLISLSSLATTSKFQKNKYKGM